MSLELHLGFKPHGMTELGPIDSQTDFELTSSSAAEEYLVDPAFRYPYDRVNLQELNHLKNTVIIGVNIDAGAGHLRPLLAFCHAAWPTIPRLTVPTMSTGWHGAGSRNRWLKSATEMIQTQTVLQNNLFMPIFHELLLHQDALPTVSSISNAITAARDHQAQMVLLHTNPDPAYIDGFFKRQMEARHGLKITNVLVMTDHFLTNPQAIWGLIDMDVIAAPDELTAGVLADQLAYWSRKMQRVRADRRDQMPRIMVSGYPQEPFFNQRIAPELVERKTMLDPDYEGPISLAVPCGGASPGMEYAAMMLDTLKAMVPQVDIWTIYKPRTGKDQFVFRETARRRGAATVLAADNDELVNGLGQRFASDRPPALVMTKPSELSNLLVFEPEQVGGAILLFTEPVGDQEKQNLNYFRSVEGGQVLPSEEACVELQHYLLSDNKTRDGIETWNRRARGWRGMCLPKEPQIAARVVKVAWETGLLAAMAVYRKQWPVVYTGQSDNGAKEFFGKLNQVLDEHQKTSLILA